MANGFSVKETINRSTGEVWAYLTDFSHAPKWMTGVEEMTQITRGSLGVGTRFKFTARGKEHETEITSLEPGKRISLTSTQGGVSATYDYSIVPSGGSTEVTLNAACTATGFWWWLHPLIVRAMKNSDSSQLTLLKSAIE